MLAIGMDYGTMSDRALLVNSADGREAGAAVFDYLSGVVGHTLPTSGKVLLLDYARDG